MNENEKVLVSGFVPFECRTVNASWTIANYLLSHRNVIHAIQLPVPNWDSMTYHVKHYISIYNPNIWLAFGESAISKQFKIEVVASTDQFPREEYPESQRLIHPDEKLCTELAKYMSDKGYPTIISKDAGGYTCEQLLYTLLYEKPHFSYDELDCVLNFVFFVHVPLANSCLINLHCNDENKLKNFGFELLERILSVVRIRNFITQHPKFEKTIKKFRESDKTYGR